MLSSYKALLCPCVKIADDSDQKILVLALWRGRIQAEHVAILREIREFYYYRWGLCQVEWRRHMQEKKGRILF
jgi:hypothetical protein